MLPWNLGAGILAMVLAAGCATRQPLVRKVSVQKVVVEEQVRLAALTIATNDFARVGATLGAPRADMSFSIVFKPLWHYGGMDGYTAGSVIELNPARLTNNPGRLAFTLRHEMTHLFQRYARGAPVYWREGICDYVACRLSAEPTACECDGQTSHYTGGYRCAAAFLAHLAARYDPEIVPRLHALLASGGYSDAWFEEVTGKNLESLWVEFQHTSGFTRAARDRNTLDAALKAPGLSGAQRTELFRAYMVNQPGGAEILDAADFLRTMAERGSLPGFERGRIPSALSLETVDFREKQTYPETQTIRFVSSDQRDLFVYRVLKPAPESSWQLTDAVRIENRTGKVVQRYNLAAGTKTARRAPLPTANP